MFELLTAFHGMSHVQQLYGSSTIEFGASQIGNQADTSGNQAADWNYGNDYGGHGTAVSSGSTFSPYSTIHHDTTSTGGMFGSWSVDAPLNSPILSEHPCETFQSHNDSSTYGDTWLAFCKNSPNRYVNAYVDAFKSGASRTEATDIAVAGEQIWNAKQLEQ
mmetsp:Transcript_39216/g.63198  ORF Transcript_39216/g.63198 Transcript_39216/m.63198 type:complete len:162 (+) Transcript_39216:248-733(+)